MATGSKRKHTTCTLQEKIEVLNRLDKGESATKLAVEFGVGKATIADWKKNRTKIEQFCTSSSKKTLENRQTSKTSKFDKVDEALFLWFVQEREKETPLSGPIVQEKALQLNNLMKGDEEFVASTGWLDRWKKRHGIRQLTITGEQLSSDNAAAQMYIDEFDSLIIEGGYSPQQVYNADETGLNFKALPNKSLASEQEARAPGFKMNKERVTLMACSNAAGNHKLPLMMIGKSKNPRAFKNVNIKTLPVYYANQKKAWMDGALFKQWFHDQFVPEVKRFSKKNDLPAKAILLIDNAPSHPAVNELSCGEIKAVFLPPNVTALLQPMDQGVLQALKLNYRKKFLRTLIEDDDSPLTLLEKIKRLTVKDVVYWSAESWEGVTQQAIRKSWRKLWTTLDFVDSPDISADRETLLQLANEVPGCEEAVNVDIDEWMAADPDPHENLNDEDIIAAVEHREPEPMSSDDEGNDNELVSHSDAAAAFDLALRYVEQNPTSTPADAMFLRRWRTIATSNRFSSLKQIKLTDMACSQK